MIHYNNITDSRPWTIALFITIFFIGQYLPAEDQLTLVKQVPNGMLCLLDGERQVLILKGTPEEMGKAHGVLMKDQIQQMYMRILLVAAGYYVKQHDSFFVRIKEIQKRTKPYIPDRFFAEGQALAKGSGMDLAKIDQINSFPELFHCSGVAVRGKATLDGKVRHVRVLDYMRDIGLQKFATLIVYLPHNLNCWASVSYPGFIGTVTAMNREGVAMGEMGGRGEGKWDGLPMAFLMRRVMEECKTVSEALMLMKSGPLTCDYYYILSDRYGSMAAVEAIAKSEKPVLSLKPGEADPRLPGALEDIVYISNPGKHADTLYQQLKKYYGRIDSKTFRDIIKCPVAASSNLHNAIFEPESLNIFFAEAGVDTPACDERYFETNINTIVDFYHKNKQKGNQ